MAEEVRYTSRARGAQCVLIAGSRQKRTAASCGGSARGLGSTRTVGG